MFKKLAKIPQFFKEIKEELKKVNWSSRKELTGATVIVVVVSALLTGYIYLVDIGLAKLVQLLLK